MKARSAGYTLAELMIGMAIMGIVCAAFATLLKYVMKASVTISSQGQSQEEGRQILMKIEEYLAHASQIQVASTTVVQFIADFDQSPSYDRNTLDCNGTPYFRSADRDCDGNLLVAAANQWKIGYNLKDDDEDGDGNIDVMQRIYYSSATRTLWFDMSLNEAAWGGRYLKKIGTDISSFTFTYWGDKSVSLDRNLDDNADGIIEASEMDNHGNRDGVLDTTQELQYVTWIRLNMTTDYQRANKNTYVVETDVYPPLLALKPQAP